MSEPVRILVLLKHALDPATVDVDPFSGKIHLDRTMGMPDPAGERALRWALATQASVTVLVAGGGEADASARHALALGAAAAFRVECASPDDPLEVASSLAAAARGLGSFDLVLTGDRSADRGTGLVPPAFAACLGLSFGGEAALGTPSVGGDRLAIERIELRGLRYGATLRLPAVVAVRAAPAPLLYASFDAHARALRADIPHPPQVHSRGERASSLAGTVPASMPYRRPPHWVPGPDPRADVSTRLEAILAGGADRPPGRIIEGDIDLLVDTTIAYLHEEGFLSSGSDD